MARQTSLARAATAEAERNVFRAEVRKLKARIAELEDHRITVEEQRDAFERRIAELEGSVIRAHRLLRRRLEVAAEAELYSVIKRWAKDS
jgi:hypothetical protein